MAADDPADQAEARAGGNPVLGACVFILEAKNSQPCPPGHFSRPGLLPLPTKAHPVLRAVCPGQPRPRPGRAAEPGGARRPGRNATARQRIVAPGERPVADAAGVHRKLPYWYEPGEKQNYSAVRSQTVHNGLATQCEEQVSPAQPDSVVRGPQARHRPRGVGGKAGWVTGCLRNRVANAPFGTGTAGS